MTNLAGRRLYNFGDTFGEVFESTSVPDHAPVEGGASWCNQADGLFEQDDAIRAQGGAA